MAKRGPVVSSPAGGRGSTSDDRAVFFLDGNNWYHSLRRIRVDSTRLDYRRVGAKLLGASRSLTEIRYYVGRVSGDLRRVRAQQRQFARLKAQGVRIIEGRVQKNWLHPGDNRLAVDLKSALAELRSEMSDVAAHCLVAISQRPVPVYTEKKVDVQLAVDLVSMAFRDEYDVAYLLSRDADFVPAAREARRMGKRVFGVKPRPAGASELGRAVDAMISLAPEWFRDTRLEA